MFAEQILEMLNFPPDPNISKFPHHQDLASAAFNFKHAVDHLDQYGFGHILTALNHTVQNSDPTIRALIQGNVDTMKRGFMLLGYFSVWEHYFDRQANPADTKRLSERLLYDPGTPSAEHWVSQDDSLRFRAIKHIRHSVAHSFNGRRAENNRPHFEKVMASANSFKGVTWTQETIDISQSQIDHDARQFFQKIASSITGRLLNNNPY